jgi:hypothetical protein
VLLNIESQVQSNSRSDLVRHSNEVITLFTEVTNQKLNNNNNKKPPPSTQKGNQMKQKTRFTESDAWRV